MVIEPEELVISIRLLMFAISFHDDRRLHVVVENLAF
jgi:hypothetical protein